MLKSKAIINLLSFIVFSLTSCSEEKLVKRNFETAENQYSEMIETIGNSKKNPRTIKNDSLVLVSSRDWTSGFFPGSLWYIYEFTKETEGSEIPLDRDKWKLAAETYTKNLEQEQYNGTTHDMGFKVFCSYGNGYRLTGNEHSKNVLLQSAKTLITRFNPVVGCIRSWDHHKEEWPYSVIIDNMMNLELLFWAAKESGDSIFYNIAISHANTTMKNHFREDYSTWHVLSYDTTNGQVEIRDTHQGYSPESCWARGESWALYGFTMCYRETKDTNYLEQAENIAGYILTNENLPDDMIPYWDFNAPDIPNEERDASAAAIMASAFYELSIYSENNRKKYKETADKILNNLSSPKYMAGKGMNNNFILMHSVGSKPGNSEVDVPIIYADYYFLEANLRKHKIETKINNNH